MGWESDLEALGAFRERLPVPWRLDDIARAAPDATLIDTSWRVLRRVFAESPPPPMFPGAQGLVDLAAMVLGAVGGQGRRAIEELALATEAPTLDFVLVPLLLTITGDDHDLFFHMLRDALDSDEPARVRRALFLVRAGYGARFCFRVTREQADALDAAVQVRRALGADDPDLAGLLAAWVPPAPR